MGEYNNRCTKLVESKFVYLNSGHRKKVDQSKFVLDQLGDVWFSD